MPSLLTNITAAVYREYDRRIRRASLVTEYGDGHHGLRTFQPDAGGDLRPAAVRLEPDGQDGGTRVAVGEDVDDLRDLARTGGVHADGERYGRAGVGVLRHVEHDPALPDGRFPDDLADGVLDVARARPYGSRDQQSGCKARTGPGEKASS